VTVFRFSPLLAAGAVALFSSSSLFGMTVDDVLRQLKLKDETVKSLQCEFQQEVKFGNSNLSSKTSGEALFAKPDKLNVHQKTPQEQLTIANGKKTWVYTPAYKQVWVGTTKKDLAKLLPKGMVPIQNFGKDLEKNYDLTVETLSDVGPSPKTVRLKAVPKQPSDFELEFVISTESWLPTETTYTSSSAQVVTRLTSVKVNPSLSKDAFQFVPPPGTDMIPF
jgi:outer membrane lipoprotein carrier protein